MKVVEVSVDEKNGTSDWPDVIERYEHGAEVRIPVPEVGLAHQRAANLRIEHGIV